MHKLPATSHSHLWKTSGGACAIAQCSCMLLCIDMFLEENTLSLGSVFVIILCVCDCIRTISMLGWIWKHVLFKLAQGFNYEGRFLWTIFWWLLVARDIQCWELNGFGWLSLPATANLCSWTSTGLSWARVSHFVDWLRLIDYLLLIGTECSSRRRRGLVTPRKRHCWCGQQVARHPWFYWE